MTFVDRRDAGRQLAAILSRARPFGIGEPDNQRPVVLGMARGGVPVAFEVAAVLRAPLEVVVVRKLGHPRQPELGLGAIAEDGVRLVNDALVRQLEVSEDVLDAVVARQTLELDRRLAVYRGDRPPVSVAGRTAIVVDDGLATGFTARAAIEVMRRRAAARVVLGVPVAPPEALEALRHVADDVACVETTARFFGLSEWYEDFAQVGDDQVAALLALAASRPSGPDGAA
ncbi:MAG TPA: phosphoribosyltransferase family protein [Acidimicrobiales bacterium]